MAPVERHRHGHIYDYVGMIQERADAFYSLDRGIVRYGKKYQSGGSDHLPILSPFHRFLAEKAVALPCRAHGPVPGS